MVLGLCRRWELKTVLKRSSARKFPADPHYTLGPSWSIWYHPPPPYPFNYHLLISWQLCFSLHLSAQQIRRYEYTVNNWLWTKIVLLLGAIMDYFKAEHGVAKEKLWLPQTSNSRILLGIRLGRLFIPITPFQVLLSLHMWALEFPVKTLSNTRSNVS